MPRSTGLFNRLLEIIGLVDDEPEEAKNPQRADSRRVTPEDARSRYGATSSGASYARGGSSKSSYSSTAYGSAGRAASYERDAYTRSSSSAQRPGYDRGSSYTRASAFERGAYGERQDPDAARRSSASNRPNEDDELAFDEPPARKNAPERVRQPSATPARRDNVVPMARDSRHHMIVYYLHTLDECRDVISDLLENKSVLLNLEDMDERVLQRAIDTLGGAAFALNATLRKASDRTYLIAPTNVDIAYTNDADRPY